MSSALAIDEVGRDDRGYLFVRPVGASAHEFTHIYRTASGVRWNVEIRALHAYEPDRWVAADLYRQIITAVASEYGVRLEITSNTIWTRIPSDLRAKIEDLDANALPR